MFGFLILAVATIGGIWLAFKVIGEIASLTELAILLLLLLFFADMIWYGIKQLVHLF